jgi:hypothetical protein
MSRGFVTLARRRSTSALSSICGGKERNAAAAGGFSCAAAKQVALFRANEKEREVVGTGFQGISLLQIVVCSRRIYSNITTQNTEYKKTHSTPNAQSTNRTSQAHSQSTNLNRISKIYRIRVSLCGKLATWHPIDEDTTIPTLCMCPEL